MKKKIEVAFIVGLIFLLLPVALYSTKFYSFGLSSNPWDWTQTASFIGSSATVVITVINIYVIYLIANNSEKSHSDIIALHNDKKSFEILKNKIELLDRFSLKVNRINDDFSSLRIREYSESGLYTEMIRLGTNYSLTIQANIDSDSMFYEMTHWSSATENMNSLMVELGHWNETDSEVRRDLGQLRFEILIEFNVLLHAIDLKKREYLDQIEN